MQNKLKRLRALAYIVVFSMWMCAMASGCAGSWRVGLFNPHKDHSAAPLKITADSMDFNAGAKIFRRF
jgi:hypothetical protein